MKLSRIFLVALLVGTLGVLGCGDDDNGGGTAGTGGSGTAGTGGSGTAGTGGSGTAGSGGSVDPNLCNLEVCALDTDVGRTAKEVCLDEYNDCVSGGGDAGTCKTLAEETCTV
jgi:hypothetical protein